jgi:polysaccharide biosynthesis protein PslH
VKILTISTSFPYPPDDGTKIQTFERVRAMSERHDVTLLCISSEWISPDRRRQMERYCKCVCITTGPHKVATKGIGKAYGLFRSLCLREPYYIHDGISPEAQSWLEREAGEFDVVETDGYANAYLRSSVRPLRVAIFHSVVDTCARRNAAVAKGPIRRNTIRAYNTLTRWYEASVIREVDLCVTLTEESRKDLQSLYPSARVRNCLSNGVDLQYFAYGPPSRPPSGACFVGKMDYTPNVDAVSWFCRVVLPLVREKLPEFRFSIVGGHPAPAVMALARDPGVTVTGYVDDIRPHVRSCGIVALPMRMGGGILNKLLQALAMGVPVVATSLSLEGLSLLPNRDLLVADTPEDLAAGIVRLAIDQALCRRLAANARRYVEATHQWSAMAGRYEAELLACLCERETVARFV